MVQQLNAAYLMGSAAGNQYEIMRKAHYEIDIQGIDSVLLCQDVNLPRIELEAVEVFHYNERIKIASAPNPTDMRVEVMDAVDPQIVGQLWTWFKQIIDPLTGEMGLASQYKRNAHVYLYAPNNQLVRTWTLEGCWPKNSPTPDEAYSYRAQHDIVTIGMNIAVDRCSIDAAQGAIA